MPTVVLRLAVVTLAALTLISGATLAVSRAWAQPEDARVSLLVWCDGSPCVMGIEPGRTAWMSAEFALRTLPDTMVAPKQLVRRIERAAIEFYPSVDRLSVGRIFFHFPLSQALSAGWIVQRFGPPCGVSIYHGGGLVTLRYPFLLANIQLGAEADYLRPHSPVSLVTFMDPHFEFASQPDPCVDNVTSRQMLNSAWHGFTSIARYERVYRSSGG